MRRKIIISLLALLSISCVKENMDPSDNIKLSQSELTFDSSSSSQSVSTEGDFWWIENIRIEGAYLDIWNSVEAIPEYDDEYRAYYTSMQAEVCPIPIPFSSESFIQWKWLTVRRTDKQHMTITVAANDTGKSREAEIVLSGGDYFPRLKITQK